LSLCETRSEIQIASYRGCCHRIYDIGGRIIVIDTQSGVVDHTGTKWAYDQYGVITKSRGCVETLNKNIPVRRPAACLIVCPDNIERALRAKCGIGARPTIPGIITYQTVGIA